MIESILVRSVAYSVVAIIAIGSWAIAQRNVDAHRAKLPIIAYIDCLQKFGSIEWPQPSGNLDGPPRNPSGSEVCKNLSNRETVD